MSYKIVTIIVTYNSRKWLDNCLGSVIEDSQIICIDNGSKDETVSHIKNYYPDVILVSNNKNVGFAEANNQGIAIALEKGATHLFLLNHDAWIEKGDLPLLLNILSNNPEYGIVSPVAYTGDGTLLDWDMTRYLSSNYDGGRQLLSESLKGDPLKDVYPIEFINAASWLITKECIEKVGVFNHEVFPHYGEDDNYILRMMYAGLQLGVCPLLKVYHDREDRKGGHTPNPYTISRKEKHFLQYCANPYKKDIEEWIKQQKHKTIVRIIRSLVSVNFSATKTQWNYLKFVNRNRKKMLATRASYGYDK